MTTRIGRVAVGRHVECPTGIDGAAVVGVAGPRRRRAERLGERVEASAHEGGGELLDAEDLDGLYVCRSLQPHSGAEDAAVDGAFVAAVRGDGEDIRAPYAEAPRTHRLPTAVASAAGDGGTVDLGASR